MLTNKHVIIAMIVAPILSVLAWIGVGQLAGEKPHAARPGQSYPLVEKSNCRYESGACDLQNEDFKLRLTLQATGAGAEMVLTASHPLEGAVIGIGPPDAESHVWPNPFFGDFWFLVLKDSGLGVESSWGQSSFGERNGDVASGRCGATEKNTTTTCP